MLYNRKILIYEVTSVILLLTSIIPLLDYNSLAGLRIPSHYNISGEVDGWSDRSVFLKIFVVELITFIVLCLAQRFPQLINLPFNVNRNNPEIRALLIEMTSAIKMWIMSVFTESIVFTYTNSIGGTQISPGALCLVLIGLMMAHLIYYCVRLYRIRER